jgi:hypothetical protein
MLRIWLQTEVVVMNLFTGVKGLEEYDKMARKVKNKRVHYKTPTYTKVYKNDIINGKIHNNDTHSWGRMRELHARLANFFPIFFSNVEPVITEDDYRVFDFGIVRVWDNVYLPETYTHQGAIYKGQEFRVIEAEIIGSEDLNIQERIYLHETLLELLEEGYRIEQLNWYIESLVNLFKQGWTANLLVLAMIMEGAKNPPNPSGRRNTMK